MSHPIRLEHILNRIWLVVCVVLLAYQFSYVPKFLKNTSHEAQDKITSTATKILDEMYLQKYGMTAEKYRWLNKSYGEVVIPREGLKKLSVQIKFTTWVKNIFFSLFKNTLIFFGFCIGSFLLIRIFPIWIIRGNVLSFKQNFETFPMNMLLIVGKCLSFFRKKRK